MYSKIYDIKTIDIIVAEPKDRLEQQVQVFRVAFSPLLTFSFLLARLVQFAKHHQLVVHIVLPHG